MERFICIHGHFYQPPRENPWLEVTERQESAGNYHDWNERITAECYAPNAVAPVLDEAGLVREVRNNYEQISFNYGPTLLSWMETQAPEVYAQILAADRASARRFGGHGSAMAQAYNHMIMPLANTRDKLTQIVWGLRDFEHRYGRRPEGMWLPETAVDAESLELMAEYGIRFTVLEPMQAGRIRKIGEKVWHTLESPPDPTMAYKGVLPSGRSIDLFFYDGAISRAVAFERLLNKGEYLAGRLVGAFNDRRTWPQLVHIATDGETYGHHHRFGEMALAYALEYIERNKLARITNYGQYLDLCPPTMEIEIRENSSWSCAHGIERWRADCGCNTGGQAGWTQQWRAPLRTALNDLRDRLTPLFEAALKGLITDPWAARNDYIAVVLNRTDVMIERFLEQHAARTLTEDERVRVLKAFEMQRHAMLMFTSCGWFFSELSGIETVQCLQYAARAIQLAHELTGIDLEPGFLTILERAHSNIEGMGSGRDVWNRFVRTARLDLQAVAAHYGIASLFETREERAQIYCYEAERLDSAKFDVGRANMSIGRVRITSRVTRETEAFTFGVVHLGEHNLNGGAALDAEGALFNELAKASAKVFRGGELPEIIRIVDRFFTGQTFSLKALFKDDLRRILDRVLSSTLTNAETVYRKLYEDYAPLMHYLREMGLPLPAALRTAAEFALNSHLRQAIGERRLDIEQIERLLAEAKGSSLSLDMVSLEATLRAHLECVAGRIWHTPWEHSFMSRLDAMLRLVKLFPFEVNLWRIRSLYYMLLQYYLQTGQAPVASTARLAGLQPDADVADIKTEHWLSELLAIGEKLYIRLSDKADVPRRPVLQVTRS